MTTSKKGSARISGIITIACALGITILNIIQNNNVDSYIMPFILLMIGLFFLFPKPAEESVKIKMGKVARRIVIAALSISLIAGILVMLMKITHG